MVKALWVTCWRSQNASHGEMRNGQTKAMNERYINDAMAAALAHAKEILNSQVSFRSLSIDALNSASAPMLMC